MELIVFCGIPGSGKTTFYRDRLLATHVRVSLDLLKTREREDILLHACFAAKQPVVVDNTHPLASQRRRLVELGHAAGFRTVLYYFDVSTRVAVGRNSGRAGKARVANVAIFATQKKLQRPTRDEGFDEMFRVSSDADEKAPAAFVVEPWQEPGT
jgi:predicted kinase